MEVAWWLRGDACLPRGGGARVLEVGDLRDSGPATPGTPIRYGTYVIRDGLQANEN